LLVFFNYAQNKKGTLLKGSFSPCFFAHFRLGGIPMTKQTNQSEIVAITDGVDIEFYFGVKLGVKRFCWSRNH
jgi:hypothetical protein